MKSVDGANRGLDAAMLSARCDPARFGFETTAELEDLVDPIGQSRAVGAVRFGVEMQREGYNIFVLGPPGMGKRTLVRRFVEERAAEEPAAPDWAYVNNFERPNRPCLLRLPPNTGARLRRDMERLAEELRPALSTAFESEEYQARRQTIESDRVPGNVGPVEAGGTGDRKPSGNSASADEDGQKGAK